MAEGGVKSQINEVGDNTDRPVPVKSEIFWNEIHEVDSDLLEEAKNLDVRVLKEVGTGVNSFDNEDNSSLVLPDNDGLTYRYRKEEDAGSSRTEHMQGFRNWISRKFTSLFGPTRPILPDANLDGVLYYMQKNNVKNIIVMTGAGLSTSAGIPDFRSPGSGLYDNLEKYNLPGPASMFEINYFKRNPTPFYALAKELLPSLAAYPTKSHYFIRVLHDKGLLKRLYTQNVDGLDRAAGIPPEKLVEAHGSILESHCLTKRCQKEYSFEWMKDNILAGKIPTCEVCEGLVKPDVVFFGESLPKRYQQLYKADFASCDLLLIMGTSLNVEPFGSLISKVPSLCPRILINKERTGRGFYRLCGLTPSLNFNSASKRDVLLLGECDEGCNMFARKLGVKAELNLLMRGNQRQATEMGKFKAK